MWAFRFSDSSLLSNVYDELASNQKSFTCRISKPPSYLTKKDKGDLNHGYSYSHIAWRKKKYFFVISSNEISDTEETFFDSFYSAQFKYICDLSQAVPTYEEVIETDDDVQKAYEEDINILPEITISLVTRGTI